MKAMAVTNFDRAADPDVFDGWICDVRSAAEAARGFVAFAASISREAPVDWAVAVTFESEDLLHQWLDGSPWKHLVRGAAARGFLRLSSDLVIIDGAVTPTGVAIVSSTVSSGMEADFQAVADPVSHRTPIVGMGRAVAVALMIGGITLVSTVTATLASWIVQRVAEVDTASDAATRAQIERLREEMHQQFAKLVTDDRKPAHGEGSEGC
jgi:hypothetical protein